MTRISSFSEKDLAPYDYRTHYYFAARGVNCATLMITPRLLLSATYPNLMGDGHFVDIDAAMNWLKRSDNPGTEPLMRIGVNTWTYEGRPIFRSRRW